LVRSFISVPRDCGVTIQGIAEMANRSGIVLEEPVKDDEDDEWKRLAMEGYNASMEPAPVEVLTDDAVTESTRLGDEWHD